MSAIDDIAWYITLLQTGGKTYDQVVFDEWIEAERATLEEGGAEMNERREFVKVERMGDKARYSVEIPITTETIHDRMDELERRIDKLERRMDGKDDMDGEMLLAIGKRLCAVERKLNHKGGDE